MRPSRHQDSSGEEHKRGQVEAGELDLRWATTAQDPGLAPKAAPGARSSQRVGGGGHAVPALVSGGGAGDDVLAMHFSRTKVCPEDLTPETSSEGDARNFGKYHFQGGPGTS